MTRQSSPRLSRSPRAQNKFYEILKGNQPVLTKFLLFLNSRPTELDAIVFGHLYTILTTNIPNTILAETINKFDRLVNFCKNIDNKYFAVKKHAK